MGKNTRTITVGRDAGSGVFIPVKTAQEHPKTTVVEHIHIPTKPKK